MMDIASRLAGGGFEPPWPSLRQLYGSSILGATPSALLLGEDGTYGLTHVLMYLYGFGIRRASIPKRQRESLRRLLSMLLVGVSQDRHWDLLAELLLCWEAIGYPATALSNRCWKALLGAQQEGGSIPCPEWARSRAGSGRGRFTSRPRAVSMPRGPGRPTSRTTTTRPWWASSPPACTAGICGPRRRAARGGGPQGRLAPRAGG